MTEVELCYNWHKMLKLWKLKLKLKLVSHNVDFSFHNIDILCQTGDFYIVIMIYRSKISDVEEMGSLEKVYVIKSNQMVSLIVFNV